MTPTADRARDAGMLRPDTAEALTVAVTSAAIPEAADRDLDDVAIVLLCWREAPGMLERLHHATRASLPEGWAGHVVLVENDAAPRTSAAARELVRRWYPHARRTLLRLPHNHGFARAMDLALDATDRPLALLLNSDGEPAPRMVHRLVAALRSHPDAIAAGPAVHGPGEPAQPPGAPYADDELHGMALLLDRRAFLDAGGFDPAYFFYGEDHDASARLRAAGHVLLRVPHARFDHGKGGRSRRGAFLRELRYARGEQLRRQLHGGDAQRAALGALARSRARALRDHLAQGDAPGAAGIALAALALPHAAAVAARRRRAPWDGAQLEAWLARHRHRPDVRDL